MRFFETHCSLSCQLLCNIIIVISFDQIRLGALDTQKLNLADAINNSP